MKTSTPISKGFKAYLSFEKQLSKNSVEAYLRDLRGFTEFLEERQIKVTKVMLSDLQSYLKFLSESGIGARSQARIISGLKAFYKYLIIEELIEINPTRMLHGPKIAQKLPEVLSIEEVTRMLSAIDLSRPDGHRNRAMLEVLYGCGLRVSELIHLKISKLHFDQGFIGVIGKGDKERIVPINPTACKAVLLYLTQSRSKGKIKKEAEDIVFLNVRGAGISRVSVFKIVKKLALEAEIEKTVSPHTFRHSFATHLYDRGADLRAIQDMLGHSSIMTTEIYSKVSQQYLRDTLQQFHPFFDL